uniref:DNA/RNA helicase domain-containing protein n=1 Tax=Brachybacterium sp. GPGPB12 TaxID=3023517 RepID=UPI00404B3FEF
MGSIFSAQGFEFPHVGVLFGRDFIARNGQMAVDIGASDNDALARMDGHATERIRNQYRVLLPRAMNSVVLYSVDPETQALLESLIDTERSTAPALENSEKIGFEPADGRLR